MDKHYIFNIGYLTHTPFPEIALGLFIIRKTKCSRSIKRSVSFYKTKRIPIHTIYKHQRGADFNSPRLFNAVIS